MKVLVEKEAEDFLEKAGFNVVERKTAKNKEQLEKALKIIGFPAVMKVSSKSIIHKAKLGGIITNIKNLREAEKAFNKLKKIKHFEEVLVQKMIRGEELILGLKNTPEFGISILVGAGGSEVEKLRDVSFRICPINEKDADEMLKETRIYKKLKKEKINFKDLKNNLLKLSKLALKYPKIRELDINPLFINKKEAIIADARIVF